MVQRIYTDTSVIGGIFDVEFSTDTKPLFDKIKTGQIKLVYSEITLNELAGAPPHVVNFLESISSAHKDFVGISQEAILLANTYIKEKVVGKTSLADCMHIALATIHKVDILASWNFKHIVNISKIRGYNSINLRLGYQTLEIRTPKEIVFG